jgi:hypothetical protein
MQSVPENLTEGDSAFIEQTCIPFLLKTQNKDGGWGFFADSDSRVEATSWALLALRESPSEDREEIRRGLDFLRSTQLADGSWPSAQGQQEGSWVTALACWALGSATASATISTPISAPISATESQRSLSQGLAWLGNERPADSRAWRRFLRRLVADKDIVAQDDAYYGWSWTPDTASWVEPTSYALLVLRRFAARVASNVFRDRLRVAESMLLDRMCPGGGWNCGNPMVYGAPGEAQIGPTVWALLALRQMPEREEIRRSLEWLENGWQSVSSPVSLALAQICLRSYGRPTSAVRDALCNAYSSEDAIRSVPGVAWSVLAMSSTQNWLNTAAPA